MAIPRKTNYSASQGILPSCHKEILLLDLRYCGCHYGRSTRLLGWLHKARIARLVPTSESDLMNNCQVARGDSDVLLSHHCRIGQGRPCHGDWTAPTDYSLVAGGGRAR